MSGVLAKAAEVLDETRQAQYGDPVENFQRIAAVAQHITGKPLTAEDCAGVLIALKIVRIGRNKDADSLLDGICYLEILARIREAQP